MHGGASAERRELGTGMKLVAIKTVTKCSVCKAGAEKRAAVDEWLARHGEKDDTGEVITWDTLTGKIVPILLGTKVSRSSLGRHIRGHCRRVEDGEAAVSEEAQGFENEEREALVRGLLETINSGERVNPDDALDLVIALGVKELEGRLDRGGGISVEQLLKAVDAKTRRGNSAAEESLLYMITGGIAKSLGGAIAGELEVENTIEAEFEELPDVPGESRS